MIRLGLCCMFQEQPIKFQTTTATSLAKMKRDDALAKLNRLCLANAEALLAALHYCSEHEIGCFRINSQILPIKTHPACGYQISDLPDGEEILRRFQDCRTLAERHRLRTCFHPDQFVVLNSPRPDVVEKSIQELEYQAEVAEWVGADVVNIHVGGAYGNKSQALADFSRNLDRLSDRVRIRLTIENDDQTYNPADLLPVCHQSGVPLVYDVHHHRCHPDLFSVEAKAKELAVGKLWAELTLRGTWFVYIVRCADDSLYTGITKDIPRRLTQHNAGTASRYTRSRLPVALVYQEPQENQSLALKREAVIKKFSRPQKELLIQSCRPF